jgi:hypothetical protein
MALADHLIERTRTQLIGERARAVGFIGVCGEKVSHA